MNRPWQIWLVSVGCMAVVLGAMGWVTVAVLRLDRSEAEARRRAAIEEDVRLALWRMDSAISPLIAEENARRTLIPEPLMDQILAVGGKLLQLQPYYRDEERG